jgi:hypothetical protein
MGGGRQNRSAGEDKGEPKCNFGEHDAIPVCSIAFVFDLAVQCMLKAHIRKSLNRSVCEKEVRITPDLFLALNGIST